MNPETNPSLVDYNEDEEDALPTKTGGAVMEGHYVGVHSSGFSDMLLKDELLKAIVECGFEHPSEVQYQCIPKAIMGSDILSQAKSGMGKTCVYVISILQLLNPVKGELSALIIAPTRELTYQVSKEFQRLSKFLPDIRVVCAYGGVPISENIAVLKEMPNILVATPGRACELLAQKAIKLSTVKFFVIDECDRILANLNMRADVQRVFVQTPLDKQVMLFSATIPDDIKLIALKYTRHAFVVQLDEKTLTLHGLQQYIVTLTEKEKTRKLLDLLDSIDFNQVVVYVTSPPRAKALADLLTEQNFPTLCITGNMRQEVRLKRFEEFKAFKSRVLVTTELFSRGIDVERVNLVINYDFPGNSNSYFHRVGRAGRFGTRGIAISFLSSEGDGKIMQEVQKRFEFKITECPTTFEL